MEQKSFAQKLDDLTKPPSLADMERQARYQNARDAVAWAWKIAQDKLYQSEEDWTRDSEGKLKFEKEKQLTLTEFAAKMGAFADELIPIIESHLNDTLEALKEPNESKD